MAQRPMTEIPGEDRGEISRRTLDRVSDGVVVLDEEFRYTYVNEPAEEILGTAEADLLGRQIWDVYPEASRTIQRTVERAFETGESMSYERYNRTLEKWFDVRVNPGPSGVTVLFADVSEQTEERGYFRRLLETTPLGIAILEPSGEIVRANRRAEELLGLSRSEIEGRTYDQPEWDIWDQHGEPIPVEGHPVTTVLETGEEIRGFTHGITLPDGSERWLSSNVAPVTDGAGTITRVVVALEDITELKRIELLTETIQPVSEALNRASTREELATAVCDLLTDTNVYGQAWITEYTPGTDRLERQAWDGEATSGAEPNPSGIPVDAPSVATAIEEQSVVVRDGGDVDERALWMPQDGTAPGTTALVPLVHAGDVYGLLGLATNRAGAFDDRERALLAALGRRVARTLRSLETERTLHAETVTELTFRSTDPGSFLVSVSETLTCGLDVLDTVPTSEEALLYYVSVEGASPAALADLATEESDVSDVRVVQTTDDPPGGVVELVMRHHSLAHRLVTLGAVVTADEVSDGTATVVCELPADRAVDRVVDRLTASFPETTLVAKRTVDRSASTSGPDTGGILADAFENDLTERQRQVLRAAVYAGFFESPRRSTASEIADALSLTQSTVSYHLRNAQRTLFERLFERL